jgi:hypothetical protein
MFTRTVEVTTKSVLAAVLFACLGLSAFGQCVYVGGGIITNVGVISPDRTLGTATGDLKGAVGVQILNRPGSPGPNGKHRFRGKTLLGHRSRRYD